MRKYYKTKLLVTPKNVKLYNFCVRAPRKFSNNAIQRLALGEGSCPKPNRVTAARCNPGN